MKKEIDNHYMNLSEKKQIIINELNKGFFSLSFNDELEKKFLNYYYAQNQGIYANQIGNSRNNYFLDIRNSRLSYISHIFKRNIFNKIFIRYTSFDYYDTTTFKIKKRK